MCSAKNFSIEKSGTPSASTIVCQSRRLKMSRTFRRVRSPVARTMTSACQRFPTWLANPRRYACGTKWCPRGSDISDLDSDGQGRHRHRPGETDPLEEIVRSAEWALQCQTPAYPSKSNDI